MKASKKPEYILGYIASVINIALGAVLLTSLINVYSYGLNFAVKLIYALVFISILLNFVGVRMCPKNRVRAGVLMLATSVPLLGYIIFVIFAPTSVYIAKYWWMSALMLLWLLAQVLSISAAVLCFMPASGQPPKPKDRKK